MLRTALTPRWSGLLVVVVVVVAVFVRLGFWQLDVARDEGRTEALQVTAGAPEVPLDDLLPPQTAFPDDGSLRPVVAQGSYVPEDQVLVPDRVLDGVQGSWVLNRFVVAGSGANLPVVRGFVTDPADAVPPDPGPTELRGALAPPEAPAEGGLSTEGTLATVDVGVLVNTWPGSIYHGFVFLTGEDPAVTADAVTPVPPPVEQSQELDWGNLGYAIQWWVFAGFALYLWWRMVREDHLLTLAEEDEAGGEDSDDRAERDAVPRPVAGPAPTRAARSPQEMSTPHG